MTQTPILKPRQNWQSSEKIRKGVKEGGIEKKKVTESEAPQTCQKRKKGQPSPTGETRKVGRETPAAKRFGRPSREQRKGDSAPGRKDQGNQDQKQNHAVEKARGEGKSLALRFGSKKKVAKCNTRTLKGRRDQRVFPSIHNSDVRAAD